jgi:hypothetical protein
METVLSVVQLNVVAPSASLRLSWTIGKKACAFLVGEYCQDPVQGIMTLSINDINHNHTQHNNTQHNNTVSVS